MEKNDFIHIYMYNSVFTCLIRKRKYLGKEKVKNPLIQKGRMSYEQHC